MPIILLFHHFYEWLLSRFQTRWGRGEGRERQTPQTCLHLCRQCILKTQGGEWNRPNSNRDYECLRVHPYLESSDSIAWRICSPHPANTPFPNERLGVWTIMPPWNADAAIDFYMWTRMCVIFQKIDERGRKCQDLITFHKSHTQKEIII